MSELPERWTKVALRELARSRMGKTILKPELTETGLPVYSAGATMEPWGFLEGCDVSYGSETLVISARGNIGMPKRPRQTPFVCTQTTIACSAYDQELVGWLYWFLSQFDYSKKSSQTTIPMLRTSDVDSFEVPLPPLAEQKRIVAKIEELFSELDVGEGSLRRARRQLGVYRQSLLKQAFEGKLTEQWRKQNPELLDSPDQLLVRIQAERQARHEKRIKDWKKSCKEWESGKLKGKKPIRPREAEVVPLTKEAICSLPVLPSPWIWTSLSELSDHIVDGTHKTPKYVEHGVLFISAKDINDFAISFTNTKFITPDEHDELWRRCKPCEGDILLTKSGTIGRVAVVKTDHEFSVFESVAVIPISRLVEPQFFAFQIFCTVQGTFGAANQKGVGVRHLHLEDIRRLPTSLPSLPEQREIVRLLDEQFTVIEQNEREIDAALKRSEALRQSILKKAFTGQLVPQDPTDEPASALLERIRKERDTGSVSKKKITPKNLSHP